MLTWQERAESVIAQGTCTYSKGAKSYIRGVYETHCQRGEGPYLITAGGKRLIDHTCGLGSNLFWSENNYGLPSTAEVVLAEKLRQKIPILEKMRFLKTGSEACQAAVRIARAFTNRNRGVGNLYHGWHNWCIASEKPGKGCVNEDYKKYDTIDELIDVIEYGIEEENYAPIGYCIVEAVSLDISDAYIYKLQSLRNVCDKRNVILIFDEVITGFRTPKYCIAQYYDIKPDLICFGKALANGYPLSVVGGKAEIMDTPGYFISSTHAGEKNSLEKATVVLDNLSEEKLNNLWLLGAWFQEEFNKLSKNIQLVGLPTRAVWKAKDGTYKTIFCQEAYKAGILLHPGAWWIMFSHSKLMLMNELEVFAKILTRMDTELVGLEGLPPEPVFRRV